MGQIRKKRIFNLGTEIATCLYQQILQFIQYSNEKRTNVPAIYLQEVIQYAIDFCGKKKFQSNI